MLSLFSLHAFEGYSNIGYAGSFDDVFSNPAAIALRQDGGGNVSFGYYTSDSYGDGDLFNGEKLSFVRNRDSALCVTAVGSHMAFKGNFEYFLEDRNTDNGELQFTYYNRMEIQVLGAIGFKDISAGIRFRGSNISYRRNKATDNVFEMFANEILSPYDREEGSQELSVDGALSYLGPFFSVGVMIDDMLYLEDGDIASSFERMGDNFSVGVAFFMDEYAKDGHLRYLKPRIGLEIDSMLKESPTFKITLDVDVQFLPENKLKVFSTLSETHGWLSNYFTSDSLELSVGLGYINGGHLLAFSASRSLNKGAETSFILSYRLRI